MDGEAGWWTTSGNIGLPPLARAMGVGRQQQQEIDGMAADFAMRLKEDNEGSETVIRICAKGFNTTCDEDSNTTCDEDSNTTCDDDSNTTCEED